jgi:hypothetical protein
MKMSIEAAMEIWKAGGGVAASEWQERAGGWRGRGPVYRRRPTPVFCKELERRELEALCSSSAGTVERYYKDVLDRVTKRFPKVRKLIVVNDPVGLSTACHEAGMPQPRFDVLADRWDVGNTLAPERIRHAVSDAEVDAELLGIGPWSALAKRLAPVPALGS